MEENIFNARQGVRKRRSQWIAFGVFKLLSYSIVLILFCILGFIYNKAQDAKQNQYCTDFVLHLGLYYI